MAKQKKKVIVEILQSEHLRVWCDNPTRWAGEIVSIEGVSRVDNLITTKVIMVHIDPRYDKNEVAREIEELLLSEVPDIFRD